MNRYASFCLLIIAGIFNACKVSAALHNVVVFSGVVVDSASNRPLESVVISVITSWDGQLVIQNYNPDKKGNFKFSCRTDLRSRMEISSPGYRIYTAVLANDEPEYFFGRIKMSPDVHRIDEIVVKTRVQMCRMSGDTVIFIPAAVKTMEGDPVIESLRHMPGVEVLKNGSVKINNQPVKYVYVNGKLLYGDDPAKALYDIDASAASAIRAYDEVDEIEEIKYGKNAQKRKVLNITTFEKMTTSLSGKVRAEGGYDVNKDIDAQRTGRYYLFGESGYYSEKKQISVNGAIDNRNALDDLSVKSGGDRKSVAAGFKFAVGIPTIGHSYGVDYNYNNLRTETSSRSFMDYFPTTQFHSQSYTVEQEAVNKSHEHSCSADYNYIKKERFSANFHLYATLSQSDANSTDFSHTIRDQETINKLGRSSHVDGSSCEIYPTLQLNRKFVGGDSFSVKGEINYRKNTANELRRDEQQSPDIRNTHYNIDSDKPALNIRIDPEYRINTSNAGTFSVYWRMHYLYSDSYDLAVDIVTKEVDYSLSGDYCERMVTATGGLGYYYSRPKYFLYVNMDYQANALENKERIPDHGRHNKNFGTFEPNFGFTYKPNATGFLSLHLVTTAGIPTGRLNDWLDADDPLFLMAGNPSLKFSRVYSLSLSQGSVKNQRSLRNRLSIDFNNGEVVNRRRYFETPTVLPEYDGYEATAGSTLISPVNSDNSIDLRYTVDFKTQLRHIPFLLNVNAGYFYINPQEGVDQCLVRTHDHRGEAGISLTSNFSSLFRVSVGSNTIYRWFENSDGNIDRGIKEALSASLRWEFLDRAMFTTSYTMECYANSSGVGEYENHILNASIGYKLFKDRKGYIGLNAYDILNRNTNFVSQINNQYISNVWRQTYSSYVSISFEYRFNNL